MTSVTNSECLRYQSTAISDNKQEQATATILQDGGISIWGMATPDISKRSAHSTLHNIHGFHKVCVEGGLRDLTEAHLGVSSCLLEWYHDEDNNSFLSHHQ
jgi:hypothetical protein